jgi:hypothetical protein
MVGCTTDTVDEPNVDEKQIDTENEVEEEVEDLEMPIVEFVGEIETALANEDLVEIDYVLKAFSSELDQEQMDIFLIEYLGILKSGLTPMIDKYYSEEFIDIHSALNDGYKESQIEFESIAGYVGESKSMILDFLEEPSHRQLVEDTFSKGYGLMSGEGSYYPVVDYVLLNNYYSDFTTSAMSEYLEILSDEQLLPTYVEEYLAISPILLAERAERYETFIKNYPDFAWIEDMRIQLNVALFKLSGPNPFDGTVDDNFEISEQMQEAYRKILEVEDCPVTETLVKGVIAFSDSRGGVLGSYEDMDAMYDNAYELHTQAGEMIYSLYLNK